MARQLIFDLAEPLPATFASFMPGPNLEIVQTLERAARGEIGETGVVVWGAPGAGKTHLLQATVDLARATGRAAELAGEPSQVTDAAPPAGALVAVDRVDAADAGAQGRLFTLYNRLAASGGQLIVASSVPPSRMALRDDIRTRMGWGLVFEVMPLGDDDKPPALAAFARARGFRLPAEVIDYLLAHGRRDMASLVRMLIALDRQSLALKRPVSLPLVRELLQGEAGTANGA